LPNSIVLPYVKEDSGRKRRFSNDMEIAALLCLAEAERKKKAGLFGGGEESLIFLSKLHYPFWAIQREENCFLIDGMGIASNTIPYSKPPEAEAFVEHLKRSTTVHELYRSTLRTHSDTFSDFTSQSEMTVKGLIIDKELLSDISALIQEGAVMTDGIVESPSLIVPRINEENAVRIGERVQEHYSKIQSEMKGLGFAIETLEMETKRHVGKVRVELEQVRERYEGQISNVRMEVNQKRAELEKERDEKTEKIAAANEKEVSTRLSEKNDWEKTLLGLEQNRSEYEKRKEMRRQKNDEVGEARWNTRLRDAQNQIRTAKGKIKSISDFIDRSNKETEKTIKNLQNTYEKLIEEEEKKVTDLENLRDSEINKKEKEMDELQEETSAIAKKIERLIELKRERTLMLEDATIALESMTPTLINVPFYLLRYEAGNKKRHRIYSPVFARGRGGLVMKIRKTLRSYSLQSKMGALLKPRSKALEKSLDALEGKMGSDVGLRRLLNQIGMTNNLLESGNFKERVAKGMEELEAEGWIKPEEKVAITSVYLPN